MLLGTPITNRRDFEYSPDVVMSFCLSVDRFCQHKSVTTVQDADLKVGSCLLESNIKTEFKHGHVSSERARIMNMAQTHVFCHWPTFVVLETPTVRGTTTEAVLSSILGVYISVCRQMWLLTVQDAVTKLYRCAVGIQLKAKLKGVCGLM